MDFKDKVQMSISDFRNYLDDDDYEFSYGTIDFLSTKPNSHKLNFKEDVIREYAPSVLGKWVIGEEINGDMSTHTNNPVIQGRIPENQEVQYRYDDDGYLIASVDIVLSKLYSKAYNILRNDNFRNVSIESLNGYTAETEGLILGVDEKVVTGFNITAITILGKNINGSVPNANMHLTQLSEDSLKGIEDIYAKHIEKMSEVEKDLEMKETEMSVILNKLEEISKKLEKNKEETMEEKIELTEIVENTETVEPVENAEIEEVKAEEQPDKIEEPEEDTMACGDKEKMAELEVKLEEAEVKMTSLETELAELREFKASTLESQKESIVASTLSQVKEFVNEETFAKFEQSGKECKMDDIGGWKNEVLASVADKALAKMSELSSKEDGILDMGTVGLYGKAPKSKGLYD